MDQVAVPPRVAAFANLRTVVAGIGWLVLLTLWCVVALGRAARSAKFTGSDLRVVAALLLVAVAGTVAWGVLLGWQRLWRLGAISALAGTAALMSLYVAAMMLMPTLGRTDSTPQPDADTAAGAGLVVLMLPTLVVVAALLTLGAGIGVLARTLARIASSPPSRVPSTHPSGSGPSTGPPRRTHGE